MAPSGMSKENVSISAILPAKQAIRQSQSSTSATSTSSPLWQIISGISQAFWGVISGIVEVVKFIDMIRDQLFRVIAQILPSTWAAIKRDYAGSDPMILYSRLAMVVLGGYVFQYSQLGPNWVGAFLHPDVLQLLPLTPASIAYFSDDPMVFFGVGILALALQALTVGSLENLNRVVARLLGYDTEEHIQEQVNSNVYVQVVSLAVIGLVLGMSVMLGPVWIANLSPILSVSVSFAVFNNAANLLKKIGSFSGGASLVGGARSRKGAYVANLGLRQKARQTLIPAAEVALERAASDPQLSQRRRATARKLERTLAHVLRNLNAAYHPSQIDADAIAELGQLTARLRKQPRGRRRAR